MIFLCLDTSMAACAVAIMDGNAALSKMVEPMARGQSERLVPMIDGAMGAAGIAYTDLDFIAAGCGPGAYTGIRIALSAARALALGADIPVLGVPTTEILAAQFLVDHRPMPDGYVLPLIDTKRGDVYGQVFGHDGQPRSAIFCGGADDVKTHLSGLSGPLHIIGDGASLYPLDDIAGVERHGGYKLIDPVVMGTYAEGLVSDSGIASVAAKYPPRPLYIRDADVSTPKNAV